MVSFTSFPKDFKVSLTKSVTMGLQPPQPVVALVFVITSPKLLQPSSVIEQQTSPLLILSQEQTWAVSGKSKTLPKEEPPSLAGKIN